FFLFSIFFFQTKQGWISIDCGIPENSSYTDDNTGIFYSSDSKFTETGLNMKISSIYMSSSLEQQFSNVRSFPQGSKNCYTFRPEQGRAYNYLIRASFMYGNYDSKNQVPEFDLYLGVNLWETVKLDNASHVQVKEILHVPLSDYIQVCLFNTNLGTPFISALELRPVNNTAYKPTSGSLVLYGRYDAGATTSQKIRDPNDIYDRIWTPFSLPYLESFQTSFTIDAQSSNHYKLPSKVISTAVRPKNGGGFLEFRLPLEDPNSQFYMYIHFAEVERLQGNQLRNFSIFLNGELWYEPEVPTYLSSNTIFSKAPVRGQEVRVAMNKTGKSTLPPMFNAFEIYLVKELLHSPTNNEDFDAVMNIKVTYGVKKNWQGDPCIPQNYTWDGLKCSYDGYNSPSIRLLDLSSSGLTGEIASFFANLTAIQHLDLSNNSLTGSIPDFLSQMPSLELLNLTGNRFTGSVPTALMERSKNGSLSLSLEDNPDLCMSDSCRPKKKNIVVPVVASVTSILVILLALLVLWSLKRKKQRVNKSDGSLESSNQQFAYNGVVETPKNKQFTFSEIVSTTNNFETAIGKGGFGTVYHGFLNDGIQVAVKVLSPSSIQGYKEFRAEAQLLLRVHHKNLVSFIGYCDEGANKAIIYEYMANGNLQGHLSGYKNLDELSWEKRLRVAVDAAQGLEYLHNGCKPPIIHRDVKTSNILLNETFQAKLADFGLSKDFPNEGQTHISTTVVGTPGYLDPEYYISNKLNEKSDVYSFGIVLLELITGRPAITKSSDERIHIVQWVSSMLATGEIRNIADQRLEADFNVNSVWKAIEVAMACLPATAIQRPTMSDVVMELKECLAMETAHKGASRVGEYQKTHSSMAIEVTPMDPEIEMSPSAR
ncbi:PREDICTED: putative leucine-rich repeat receptor-like serine/threonine-protein kinase At2g19230, partial [Nelumbo nucifera]|uniref:non-specific serine/threonine protein kinase n=1 Tax=Nelumbo nucifera TaxID=4432 RepID=A0A1U8QA76_NELNU